jgi:type VI secretion system protein ImpK
MHRPVRSAAWAGCQGRPALPVPVPKRRHDWPVKPRRCRRSGVGPLAAAAQPLLDLMGRLANAGMTAPPQGEELRERALRAFRQFEIDAAAANVPAEQVRAAHYILCASLDDVVLSYNWGQGSIWSVQSLVATFHQEVKSGDRFFDVLAGMQKDPGRWRDALEVAYLCPLARLPGALPAVAARRFGTRPYPHRALPAADAGAAALGTRTLTALAGRGCAASRAAPRHPGLGCRLRRGLRARHGLCVAGQCDERGVRTGCMSAWPRCRRAGCRISSAPRRRCRPRRRRRRRATCRRRRLIFLATLRSFLKPEIDRGLLTVFGDGRSVTVRIKGRGMFASGSATVDPQFVPMLQRIGEGLRTESGRVMVIGHSDNQPIRTVRFPSNFHLSQARAEAASAIISAATAIRPLHR